jgi:hypothetical protein
MLKAGAAVRTVVALEERLKNPRLLIERDAATGVAHAQLDALAAGAHLNRHRARIGKPQRVAHQVHEDLPDAHAVADDEARRPRVDLHPHIDSALPAAHPEQACRPFGRRPQIERLGVEVHAARFELGRIEDLVEDGQQRFA